MIPLRLKFKWAWRLPIALFAIALSYLLIPIACLFTRTEIRTDTLKRKARMMGLPEYTQFTEPRIYLHRWFRYLETHDNAMCEFWHGDYRDRFGINDLFTYEAFEKLWLLRYYNIVRWAYRNTAYTFRYEALGVPQSLDEPSVFKDGDTTLYLWNDYFLYERVKQNGKKQKTGWNSHRSAPVLANGRKNVMYAIS